MSATKETLNERVERRVDEILHEFFTECPYGRKSVSSCPALGGEKKFSFADYASQFFNDCPYGKRAAAECPYGRKLAHGDKSVSKCPFGFEPAEKKTKKNKHSCHKFTDYPEYVNEFFTECPYGKRAASECPYGREILEKAHKKALNKTTSRKHHFGHGNFAKGHQQHDFAKEFFTECPYGRRATAECPYGREVASHTAHPKYAKEFFTECPYGRRVANECPYGRGLVEDSKGDYHSKYSDYAEEFFTECPYGRRATAECPYGREVVEKASKHDISHCHRKSSHPDYLDEFFMECPYGRRVAEECPYGHEVLEKAGVEVPPLKKTEEAKVLEEEPAKCPFASMAGADQSKCPVSGATNAAEDQKTSGKCPVGGVLPQSEKCPISPNYKKTLTPVVDVYETINEFKFYVELPGVEKDDVKVDLKDNVLTLTAEVKAVAGDDDKARFTERKFGVFSRIIPLHSNVAVEKIEAKLENGILAITVPKGVPSITKSIDIQ
ncbi:MAG: hypothetical protein EXX96DRAFT_165554 [Benjaminiella poitrasii]|nr:MAG: hypothetical protein EXX96DRAFT_165554 [Benjaminiella poitrasii]